MTLLEPWTALAAAGAAVPLLLLLYVLKLRRLPYQVPSTLLWRQSVEDLLANTPFQRLRPSWLLLVQLLALLLGCLALGRPALSDGESPPARMIIILDASASMTARSSVDAAEDAETPQNRFDLARSRAIELIDRSLGGDADTQIMVIAFGAKPWVVSPFQTNGRELRRLIEALEPTEEPGDLAACFRLADAFTPAGDGVQAPDVVLISDGAIPAPVGDDEYTVRTRRFTLLTVADEDEPANIGITSFTAERSMDEPGRIELFARLVHTGAEPVEAVLHARLNGELASAATVALPAPGTTAGEAVFSTTLDQAGAAVVSLSIVGEDALAADDSVAAVVPAVRPLRIALSSPPGDTDRYLKSLLEKLSPDNVTWISADALAALPSPGERFDLAVLDRVDLPRPPAIPTISFGGSPVPTVQRVAWEGGKRVLSWTRTDELLRQVDLEPLRFADVAALEAPDDAEVLALTDVGPIIVRVAEAGAEHVVIGFALSRSNWFLQPGFVIFMQNAVEGLAEGGGRGRQVTTGAPVTVPARPGVASVTARSADGVGTPLVSRVNEGSATFAGFSRAGLYALEGVAGESTLAVNLLSDAESDCRGRDSISVNRSRQLADSIDKAAPRELWPWAVMAMLALLALEWLVWLRRTAA